MRLRWQNIENNFPKNADISEPQARARQITAIFSDLEFEYRFHKRKSANSEYSKKNEHKICINNFQKANYGSIFRFRV